MTKEEAMLLEDAVQSAKSAHKRIDVVVKEVNDLQKLTEAVAVTANNVERLQTDVTEMKEDVKSLTAVPAKRWEAVVAALISGVIGVIVGLIFK